MAPTKTKTKPKPKLSLREELIAAGRASEKAPLDPTAVLEDIRNTISKIDNAVDSLGDAADQAQVRLAVEMGAKPEDVDALVARMAARKAAKQAARDGKPPPSTTAGTSAGAVKKGWKAPQDPQTRLKALQDGAPAAPESLLRCWHCFPDLPPASSADWLGRGSPGESDRPGQPMKRFLQPGPHRNFPTRQRSKIYIMPLGDVGAAPPTSFFTELLKRCFLSLRLSLRLGLSLGLSLGLRPIFTLTNPPNYTH